MVKCCHTFCHSLYLCYLCSALEGDAGYCCSPQQAFEHTYSFMNWILLIVAGCCEVGFTYCLGRAKDVSGVEWWLWMAGFLLFTVVSMGLLAKVTQTMPVGLAYPVWTGIGAVGTVLVGIFFFNEPATFLRLFFTTTLIASIVGLKMLA